MGVVNQPENLLTRIKDLERQVRELRRGSLFNAAITNGGLEVRTPDGDVILRAGDMDIGGQTAYGMPIFRRNGTLQARFFDTAGGDGYWSFFDESGNIVASNDTVSGFGLARPYLTGSFMPFSEVSSPPIPITSATFVITHRAHFPRQHPRVRVLLLCDSDADTTGEVILTQSGVQVGPTVTVDAASNIYTWLEAPVTGAFTHMLYLDIQVRRTGGTGNVRVAPAWVGGVQS